MEIGRTITRVLLTAVAVSALALLCAAASSEEPVRVIFDTDMVEDYDDVGAMAVLHSLADAGECKILAMASCTRDNCSVAAIEIIIR